MAIDPETLRRVMAALGRKGGKATFNSGEYKQGGFDYAKQ